MYNLLYDYLYIVKINYMCMCVYLVKVSLSQ